MSSTQQQARFAGLLYLLLALSAPFGLLVVPGKLIVYGNATATADKIRASEWLLRLGIASELIHQTIAVFLVLALYRLFKAVDETLARQVVILGALLSVADHVRQCAQRPRGVGPRGNGGTGMPGIQLGPLEHGQEIGACPACCGPPPRLAKRSRPLPHLARCAHIRTIRRRRGALVFTLAPLAPAQPPRPVPGRNFGRQDTP